MRITVLTGGASSEREVAIASASQVVAALRARGHTVSVVDLAGGYLPEAEEHLLLKASVNRTPPDLAGLDERERQMLLSGLTALPAIRDAEVVFLGLHGGRGEGGALQAVLDVAGVSYTGSGALACGMAMDKDVAKQLFRQAAVPTPDWVMAPVPVEVAGVRLGWPLIVKPSKQGSTVGLTLVRGPEGFDTAVAEAFRHDDEVMVEAFVAGRELTVGVLDGAPLAVGEIIPQHEIFDYECKYQPGMAQEIFPADLPASLTRECQRLALTAHQALKLGGYSRVDFRLTPDGHASCLEVNTLPGLTPTSLLPQSAAAAGIEFGELCEMICRTARRTAVP